MKFATSSHSPRPRDERAASMLIVLVILSAIVITALSFFNVTIKEGSISSSVSSQVRADLAVRAAFEDASDLLISQTANDTFLTQVLYRETPGEARERYTAILQPGPERLEQIPLVSGSKARQIAMPEIAGIPYEDLLTATPVPQNIEFIDIELDRGIETYGLTYLGGSEDSPEPASENRRPEVGVVEVSLPSDQTMRYRFWIEDLQGFPNLDVVGTSRNSDAGNWNHHILYGIGPHDNRVNLEIPVPGTSGTALYQFPEIHRGQALIGQVAPGLSPREIHIHPWAAASQSLTLTNHPFREAGQLAAQRSAIVQNGAFDSAASSSENRFAFGLSPYDERPLIPYGHDYPDEGQPKYSLNRRVQERNLFNPSPSDRSREALYQIIERNLPDFESRGGMFPDSDGNPLTQDYLATICAGILDYADEDSVPSTPDNVTDSGPLRFRGADSYPTISEMFFKFTYLRKQAGASSFRVLLEAEPMVEFWNSTNQVADLGVLTMDLQIIESFGFSGPAGGGGGRGDFYELEMTEGNKPYLKTNQPLDTGVAVRLEPNEYKVVNFGKMEWQIDIPKPRGLVDFQIRSVANLRSSSGKPDTGSSRIHYEIYATDPNNGSRVMIDTESRQMPGDRTSPVEHGIFVRSLYFGSDSADINNPSWSQQIPDDTFMIRGASIGVHTKNSSDNATVFGDPFMPYYVNATHEVRNYARDGSPGARHFFHSQSRNWYKEKQATRFWMDGGFDSPVQPPPRRVTSSPDRFQYPPARALAPFYFSNSGRYFSTSELGNVHDPVMWMVYPKSVGADRFSRTQSEQLYQSESEYNQRPRGIPDANDPNYGAEADAFKDDPAWGGGNTLRIGRKEHTRFDRAGMRASQLLDLFHEGVPGSNLSAAGSPSNEAELYDRYRPSDHQPLPAARDAEQAEEAPYTRVYREQYHAQSPYRKIHGQINLNSAPTQFEVEALVRRLFVSTNVHRASGSTFGEPTFEEIPNDSLALLENHRLDPNQLSALVATLMERRPYFSRSHLARVVGEAIEAHDLLPEYHNDRMAEETFAALMNLTTFSSRHFRIFTQGEITHDRLEGHVIARSARVYEVFLRPIRNVDGTIQRVECEVLSARDI